MAMELYLFLLFHFATLASIFFVILELRNFVSGTDGSRNQLKKRDWLHIFTLNHKLKLNFFYVNPLRHLIGIVHDLAADIDSPHSFEVCKSIHEKLMDLVGDRVPLVLVGNKTDLHVDRRVTHEQGKKLAEEMKAVFMETSAKQNQNVEDIFKLVVSQMESLDGGVQGDDKKNCLIM